MKKNLKNIDLNLITQLALSIVILLIGGALMIFKTFGLNDIILYVSILFYTFSFFSVICYFIKRKDGDYEILLLSLINIIIATFMFVLKNDDSTMVLGLGMLVYTVLVLCNRGYKIINLRSENNFMWIIKFISTFLITLVGILTSINLFTNVTVETLMFGYYFISFGFILLIEDLIELFVTEDKFEKIISILLDENKNKLEEVKEEALVVVEPKPKRKATPKATSTSKKTTSKINKPSVKKSTEKTTTAKKTTTKKSTTEVKRKPGRPRKNN